jgi:hypothetical protein
MLKVRKFFLRGSKKYPRAKKKRQIHHRRIKIRVGKVQNKIMKPVDLRAANGRALWQNDMPNVASVQFMGKLTGANILKRYLTLAVFAVS